MKTKSTEKAGNSWALDQQLCTFQGTKLGTLYVGDSCVAWCIWGASAELILYDGMSCSALMQGRGAWAYLNLMVQALLTPFGSPYPLGEVDG